MPGVRAGSVRRCGRTVPIGPLLVHDDSGSELTGLEVHEHDRRTRRGRLRPGSARWPRRSPRSPGRRRQSGDRTGSRSVWPLATISGSSGTGGSGSVKMSVVMPGSAVQSGMPAVGATDVVGPRHGEEPARPTDGRHGDRRYHRCRRVHRGPPGHAVATMHRGRRRPRSGATSVARIVRVLMVRSPRSGVCSPASAQIFWFYSSGGPGSMVAPPRIEREQRHHVNVATQSARETSHST